MPEFDGNYWGVTDWPWLLLYEYNLLDTTGTKYDSYDLEENKSVHKLCNKKYSTTIYVKFDPALINAE